MKLDIQIVRLTEMKYDYRPVNSLTGHNQISSE